MTNATEFRAPVEEVSGAESFEVFNNIVRRELGLSGNDFLTRYDAGFYDVDPDSVPGLSAVLTALPFAR